MLLGKAEASPCPYGRDAYANLHLRGMDLKEEFESFSNFDFYE